MTHVTKTEKKITPIVLHSKQHLEDHLIKKKYLDQRLCNDPALKNIETFKASCEEIREGHLKLQQNPMMTPKKIGPLVILGNSFSWQGHVLNYFNSCPPSQNWHGFKIIHIPYSSSYLEASNNINTPFHPRPDSKKGKYNGKSRKKALRLLPRHINITVLDMVNSGAGLASFLNLKKRLPKPKILAFVPKPYNENSPLKNKFFEQYEHHAIQIESHAILQEICNDIKTTPIRGIPSAKIYEPPSKNIPKDPLFMIKKSKLIYEITQRYKTNPTI
ncbi:MAG: hypothetical protein VW397_00955 [Candidatus Margulisiibacteriota bacterium]